MLCVTLSSLCLWLALGALWTVRGADFPVTVGGPGILQFTPSTVTNASMGDTITFTFKQSNHTATQSTFDDPCEMAPNGFDTGFIPVPDDNTDGPFPSVQYTMQDANPVWVYCRQESHCLQGMVFAINPGDQFPAFRAAAVGAPDPATVSVDATNSSHLPSSSPAAQTSTLSSALPQSNTSTAITHSPTMNTSATVTKISSGLSTAVSPTSSTGTPTSSNSNFNGSKRTTMDCSFFVAAAFITLLLIF